MRWRREARVSNPPSEYERGQQQAALYADELSNLAFVADRDEAVRAPALACRHGEQWTMADGSVKCLWCGWWLAKGGQE